MNHLQKQTRLRNKKPPRNFRWAMGLTCLLIVIVSAIAWVFETSERASILQSRQQLVKAITIETASRLDIPNRNTGLRRSQIASIDRTFKQIISSNDDLLFLGLRNGETLEVSAAGVHPTDPNLAKIGFAEPLVDDSGNSRVVECCFRPIYADRPLGAWIAPHYAAAGLFAIAALFAVPLYFRCFARRFELSNVVPKQTHQTSDEIQQQEPKESADTVNSNPFAQRFLSRFGHETRTAMNAILGYVEILSDEIDDPDQQAHLQSVSRHGSHLICMSHDMLELANLKLGETSFESEPVCIFSLVDEVLSELRQHADSKQIYLKSQNLGKLPVTVNASPNRLRQALSCLVTSAIEFTQHGGVLLETSVVNGPKLGHSSLRFTVKETGDSMDPEMLATLFEPFSGPDFGNVDHQIGTEFGLAICRELAARMGGKVIVATNEEQGRTFTLTVDIGKIDGVEMVDHVFLTQKKIGNAIDGQVVELPPMHVLIVDDGESNRLVVSAFLKKTNATFEFAINGQEAVDMVNGGNFSAVLMDMRMPIMNGFEATQTLRSQGHDLPIIALTANATEEDQKACTRAGCSAFLAKPIARDRLLQELSLAMAGRVVYRDKPVAIAKPVVPTAPADQVDVEERVAAETVATKRETTSTVIADAEDDERSLIGSSLPMDDEDFIEVAEIFVAGLHKKNSQMSKALKIANFPELVELGHWLKGAAGSAGYGELSPLGLSLEEAARAEDMGNCARSFDQIMKMSAKVRVITSETDQQLMPF